MAADGAAITSEACLQGSDLDAVYWEHQAMREEMKRKERFWASTNNALERAYADLAERTEQLKAAQQRIVELERQRTEQVMAGGFAHEVRNALSGAKLMLEGALQGAAGGSLPLANAKVLREVATVARERMHERDSHSLLPLLKEAFEREEQVEDVLTGSTHAVQRALALVTMLLDYSKTGSERGAEEPVDLKVVCEDVVRAQQPRADSQGIALRLHIPAEHAVVTGDRTRLHSAVENLVLNALDAHRECVRDAPSVEIRLAVVENFVNVWVEDNACGVPASLRDRIFEPFFSTKPNTGTGLGLPFAQKIVASCAGQLALEPSTGIGATFRIRLPRQSLSKGES